MVTSDERLQERIMRDALRLAADTPFDQPPVLIGAAMHRMLREMTGNDDPYRAVKDESNELALRLLPELRRRVQQADDPFEVALRFAMAGNVIDFGQGTRVTEEIVLEALEHAASQPLHASAVNELRNAAADAESILYLADNAGEIVLDRLLIEQLDTSKVTLAVRGGPVINDATRDDAITAGLDKLVEIIDNGTDIPGTVLPSCSQSFRERFDAAGIVIAKGQGNYESLSGADRDVFFLLKTKCPVVARDLGCEMGHLEVRRKPGRRGEGTTQAETRL